MPYIGAKELKASDIRRFDVTSSTSATHTLTWTPPTEQSLIVTINGIKQHEDAYSVSGTTLTLSSPLVATDKLEVIGINDIGTTITPAQNSVNTDKIADNAVTTAKIADDQITSAKLANAINITSGNSLTIDSGATVTNNGTASGFGKVLQVVQTVKSDTFSTAAASFTDITGLSASITPSSSSNKILIQVSIGTHDMSGGTAASISYRLMRDSTAIGLGDSSNQTTFAATINADRGEGHSMMYLDSPSSTSSINYKVQAYSGNTLHINYRDGLSYYTISTITLMEIAG